jgi:hypothetical protein
VTFPYLWTPPNRSIPTPRQSTHYRSFSSTNYKPVDDVGDFALWEKYASSSEARPNARRMMSDRFFVTHLRFKTVWSAAAE